MALIGNCTHIEYNRHETETTVETVTYPDGTIEEVNQPVIVKNETDYQDVYLCIKQIENSNIYNGVEYMKVIFYHYAAYENKEVRNADQENFLFWVADAMAGQLDHTRPLYEQVYDDIKTKEGLTNLIDD